MARQIMIALFLILLTSVLTVSNVLCDENDQETRANSKFSSYMKKYNFGLGAFLGYGKFNGADDSAYYYGGDFEARFRKFFIVRFEAGQRNDPVIQSKVFDIESNSIPILMSILFRPFGHWLISPYLISGGGLYLITDKLHIKALNIDKVNRDTEFGWHVGTGLEFNLSEHIVAKGDFRWIFLEYEIDDIFVDRFMQNFNEKVDAYGIWVTFGLSYFF